VEGKDSVLRTIERRPDGKWLGYLDRGAVGADGSLAVLDGSVLEPDAEVTVNLYEKTGEPARTIRLPPSVSAHARFAYDGERLVVADGPRVVVFDRSGRPLQQFQPPPVGKEEPYWQPFLIAREQQLWLYDGQFTVRRYALR
jgi:hypothetical protein